MKEGGKEGREAWDIWREVGGGGGGRREFWQLRWRFGGRGLHVCVWV